MLLLLAGFSSAQPFTPYTPPKNYICYRTTEPLQIDGKLRELDWMAAPWTDYFTDIADGPEPWYKSRVKMLWDDHYLYIAAEMQEPHLWATLTEHDAIIYRDNDFEVFIDPDGDTHDYMEIEVNAFNAILDLMLGAPYRDGGPMLMDWTAIGMKHALFLDGTLNNPADFDSGWYVEMAIPISLLCQGDSVEAPKDGSIWRINFSRVQYDLADKDGKYIKLQGTTAGGDKLEEHNWVWSKQGLINMHYPEMWGFLQFSRHLPGTASVRFTLPDEEPLKWWLRQVYYRQVTYKKENGAYALDLAALGIDKKDLPAMKLTLESDGKTYLATLAAAKPKLTVTIDHKGQVLQTK
jgi:hypothetical protein